ncbi:putative protein kinase [Trypanosoma grayi]|uniref:putative protein kinase n=1 Tax=Trypanosoma grayi TaxID=71804 RepID=UPI0004F46E91|nr:putative protein kinase [Trypanosoma grayi]KEG06269.1 putative protein kinase [Trypanosoma grayi]
MLDGPQGLVVPGARWRDDSSAEVCGGRRCGRPFTLFHGRHHCRWCGGIFCEKCAPPTGEYGGRLLRRCNACRLPAVFRSMRRGATGPREAVTAQLILSFLDDRSINALLQSCYTSMSEFHVGEYVYYDTIMSRFPSFFDGARIGKGGTGVVYKCEDRRRTDSTRVALKVITKSSILTLWAWRKIITELAIMQDTDHPNVVHVLEVFQTPLHFVIVMEVGDGGTLTQALNLLRRRRCNMAAFTASVVSQVAQGLNYLYRKKRIVHRDIKHDNIVLTFDYTRAMIIDFGLAEYITSAGRQVFKPCGTVGFASPENVVPALRSLNAFEATGDTMHRADVYSLGVVAFMMLSGQRPLKGTGLAALHQEMRGGVLCIGPRWAGVSDSAKALIEGMLSFGVKTRPTAEEVESHPFIVSNAPLIGEIAKWRNHDLALTEEAESNEWVYVAATDWRLGPQRCHAPSVTGQACVQQKQLQEGLAQ